MNRLVTNEYDMHSMVLERIINSYMAIQVKNIV